MLMNLQIVDVDTCKGSDLVQRQFKNIRVGERSTPYIDSHYVSMLWVLGNGIQTGPTVGAKIVRKVLGSEAILLDGNGYHLWSAS